MNITNLQSITPSVILIKAITF